MRVLVVNAGSSSLKLDLLGDGDEPLAKESVPADAGGFDTRRLEAVLRDWDRPDAVGHRIVHGGTTFTGPVRVDKGVREQLGDLVDLAPLHQPKSLAALDAVTERLPDVPAVACFDTAFHATLAAEASTYAVPAEWRQRWAIRRYGFHGLSHGYASARAAAMVGRSPAGLRVVTCHLGAGASLAAVLDGRSADTTMGFTPLEGLVMATRSGSVDPGLVVWLADHEHLAPADVGEALEKRSGLAGLAGTADMREVEASAAAGDADAVLALDVYLHRLAGSVAAMVAAIGGLDVLVFTGGVGEASALVRERAARRLAFLGVAVDAEANGRTTADGEISAAGAAVRTLVVTAREDLRIAAEVRGLLAGSEGR